MKPVKLISKLLKAIAILAVVLTSSIANGQVTDNQNHIDDHLTSSFKFLLPELKQLIDQDSLVKAFCLDPNKRVEFIVSKRQSDGQWIELAHYPEPLESLRGFNYRYFYPASLVKLPTMLATFRKLNQLNISNWQTITYIIGNECGCTNFQAAKSRKKNQHVNKPLLIDQFRRICLYSDNQSYNALYDIAGRGYINECLHNWGVKDAVVAIRFAPCSDKQHRINNSVKLYRANQLIYNRKITFDQVRFNQHPDRFVGVGYIKNGKRYDQPADFTNSSNLSISDCHRLLGMLIERKLTKLGITSDQADSLLTWLGQVPRESHLYHSISPASQHDAVKKYLLYGARTGAQVNTNSSRIINIVGQSHGWLSDVAYFKSNHPDTADIRVSSVLMVNKSGIIGSGLYQTNKGMTFLQRFGRLTRKIAAINIKK